ENAKEWRVKVLRLRVHKNLLRCYPFVVLNSMFPPSLHFGGQALFDILQALSILFSSPPSSRKCHKAAHFSASF
ncbi:MAG: hypothetical protein ABIH23_10195, partial [bacterium]